ncbi:DUF6730 family protein [Joostella sp. CR20]|uniref:DUF6730 family protein n=1 Tax=Joostella sp. CR20 TaxID=2804312 RepID=UPI00313E01C5
MKKIEQITELLIEEIADFKKSVDKLESINNISKSTKLKVDFTHLNSYMNNQFNNILSNIKVQNEKIASLESAQKAHKIIPKSYIWLYSISILICISTVAHAVYYFKQTPTIQQNAYEKGRNEVITHFSKFINHKPKIKEEYEKWIDQEH